RRGLLGLRARRQLQAGRRGGGSGASDDRAFEKIAAAETLILRLVLHGGPPCRWFEAFSPDDVCAGAKMLHCGRIGKGSPALPCCSKTPTGTTAPFAYTIKRCIVAGRS